MRLFCVNINAAQIVLLTGVSRVSINKLADAIRQRIAEQCQNESPFTAGEIELDESYFGARRVSGKRGRCTVSKIPVFGMLKKNGCVYTQIVRNCGTAELLSIVEQHTTAKDLTTFYTDGFKSYDGLADLGYGRHFRVNHGAGEFVNGRNHINGIENFWGICKVRQTRFRGIHKHKFYLHLKECEFRYNHRNENIYLTLLKIIRKNPLKLS